MTSVSNYRKTLKVLVAFGCMGSLLALAGCNTPTYGTGEAPELSMLREVTGTLVASKPKTEPIEYRPRSELVMPPDAKLNTPEENIPIEQVAAWPNDADQQGATRASNGEIPEEFRRGRLARGAIKADPAFPDKDVTEMNTYERLEAQRRYREIRAAAEGGSATTRKYLTEPPLVYREPSPNAPQPEDIQVDTAPRTLFGSLWKRWRD